MGWAEDATGGVVWDDAEPVVSYPALEGTVNSDVCVIGLGGSGLAAIAECRRRGLSVLGIDATRVGGGAAGRNGGFLLAGMAEFHHDAIARFGRARAVAAYQLTLEELDRMAAGGVGSFRRADSPAERADCEAHLNALLADGFPAAWHEGPDGEGVFVPTDAAFQPLARCRLEAKRVVSAGAHLFEATLATAIASGRVSTGGGTIHCATVIVAVDGGLEVLVPSLVGRVRTARLQMLATEPDPRVVIPRPVYSRWGYDYWHQRGDARIVLGGCRDLFVDDEWDVPAEPTRAVQDALERLLRDVIGSGARVSHRWAGQSAFTPDLLPVVEAVDDGVIAIGGYSGTGNIVGRLCGRAAVELAIDGRSETAAILAGPA